MNNVQFCKGFRFTVYHFSGLRINDNTRFGDGVATHFIGRMRCGTGRLCGEEYTVALKPGDIFYIPKGWRYRSFWYPDETGSVSFDSFGFDCFPQQQNITYPAQVIDCDGSACQLLQMLADEPNVDCAGVGRLYTFLSMVLGGMTKNVRQENEVVENALAVIREDPSCPVGEIAHRCGISESALYRAFRTTLHKTPVEARHAILAEHAVELLLGTDYPVEVISDMLNFSSSAYFRRVLRSQTGKTPREIRKNALF